MHPVVVTGRGALCAAGEGVEALLDLIRSGRSALAPARHGPTAAALGAPIGEVDLKLGDTRLPRIVTMAATVASEALSEAALVPRRDRPIDLIVGNASGSRGEADYRLVGAAPQAATMHDAADRFAGCTALLAEKLGIDGRIVTLNTACSSGLSAVAHGWELIATGRSTCVLCVGVEEFTAGMFLGFKAIGAVASEACSPFRLSTGTSFSEGAAAVVLERGDIARGRGATVFGTILGTGQSADAFDLARPDPHGAGALLAIRRALGAADATDDDVSLVGAHGTGTRANDAMESELYADTFARVPVLATKGLHGHAVSASALLELIVTMACLYGLRVIDACWHPRHPQYTSNSGGIALKSAFDVGGLNTSLVVSRDPPEATPTGVTMPRVVAVRGAWVDSRSLLDSSTDGAPATVSRRDWRRMDLLTKLTYTATARVMEADWLGTSILDNVGLAYATAEGPILSWIIASDALRTGKALNPRIIPRLSHTSAPAWTSQILALRGPVVTYFGGPAGSLAALDHATMVLELEIADAMIVVAADEYTGLESHDRALFEYSEIDSHSPVFAEGHAVIASPRARPVAAAVLLAREDTAEAWEVADRISAQDLIERDPSRWQREIQAAAPLGSMSMLSLIGAAPEIRPTTTRGE